MAKKTLTKFTVWAKATIECNVTIEAACIDDALAKSKELTDSDFFTVIGEYCDGECRVTGVMEGA